jgi:hypothetical protein
MSIPSAVFAVVSTSALRHLLVYEDTCSLRPSSLICIYLLGSIIFGIAQVRTLWLLHPANHPIAAIATAALTICSLLLLLETQKQFCLQYGHISPESSAGIFSHSTYWWLNRLFIGGFRGNLSLDNLFPLDKGLSSKVVAFRHHQQWMNNEGECPSEIGCVTLILIMASSETHTTARTVL